ncbi:hypothetical protein HOY80DRAFT_1003156 [Tuber brumale]|nr:hypothetical protein HOY80DRAFT_1003156 [Tuber brumale]
MEHEGEEAISVVPARAGKTGMELSEEAKASGAVPAKCKGAGTGVGVDVEAAYKRYKPKKVSERAKGQGQDPESPSTPQTTNSKVYSPPDSEGRSVSRACDGGRAVEGGETEKGGRARKEEGGMVPNSRNHHSYNNQNTRI